jgi:hypothetical protein
VAIKVGEARSAARLIDEAEALARLDHPHIIRVIEVIEDGGRPAIVMPLAAGGSLAELLAGDHALTPGELVAIAAPIAEALASAHARGLVHGDVKPTNVLLTADGQPLLSDFGAGAGEGTAPFVAPEVLAGGRATAASDVYSLGVLSSLAIDARGVGAAGLRAVIERACAVAPADRFATAAELARALRSAVPADAVRPPRPSRPAVPGRPAPLDLGTRRFGPGAALPTGSASGSPRRWAVALAAIAMAGCIGALVWWTSSTDGVSTLDCGASAASTIVGALGAPLPGDTDGDGCDDGGRWFVDDEATGGLVVVVRLPGRTGPVRYVAGRVGDVPLLGDWDCDGTDTLALYRPATGEVFRFDAWPTSGPLRRRPAIRAAAGGRPRVLRAGACDRLVIDPST